MKFKSYIFILVVFMMYSFTSGNAIFRDNHAKSLLPVVSSDTLKEFNDSVVFDEEEDDNLEIVDEETKASYYHDKFTGKKTASGVVFDNKKYTAAHRTLPFGTKVKVTNVKNKRSVILTITDRGPFVKGRGIDLSKQAFFELTDNKARGVLDVKIEKLTSIEN